MRILNHSAGDRRDQSDDKEGQRGEHGRRRDSQNPGPYDSAGDPPFNCREARRRSDPGNRARDGVRCGHGNSGRSGAKQRDRARSLCTEAADWPQLGDL